MSDNWYESLRGDVGCCGCMLLIVAAAIVSAVVEFLTIVGQIVLVILGLILAAILLLVIARFIYKAYAYLTFESRISKKLDQLSSKIDEQERLVNSTRTKIATLPSCDQATAQARVNKLVRQRNQLEGHLIDRAGAAVDFIADKIDAKQRERKRILDTVDQASSSELNSKLASNQRGLDELQADLDRLKARYGVEPLAPSDRMYRKYPLLRAFDSIFASIASAVDE